MRYLLIFVFTILCASSKGQDGHFHNCGSSHINEALLRDKAIEKKQQELDQLWSIYQKDDKRLAPPPYTLPVVVHIIHNNGPENISNTLVNQAIQDLNDAFSNNGYYNQMTGVDTRIQFCLAQRDPNGLITNGITRTASALTTVNMNTQDIALKNLSRWDPTQYINIWIVNEICSNSSCSVAGYAYYPSAHGQLMDGIVLEYDFMGVSPANSSVLAHEMGHYLGLYHTFQGGCANNNCAVDGDKVCDTPPDASTANIPCGIAVNSCTTDVNSGFSVDQNDLITNFMDYSSLTCYSDFTTGQRDRMHFSIDQVRTSLLQSPACLPPCSNPITSNFTTPSSTITVGSSLNFTNLSTGNTNSWTWLINGTPFSTGFNTSYQFNTIGAFEISLLASSNDPLCTTDVFSLTIEVNCNINTSYQFQSNYIAIGQNTTFTNSSQNATSSTWLINNNSISNNSNLQYTFNTPGIYEVCLQSANGLCSDNYCEYFVVNASGLPDTCSSTFAYSYNRPNVNDVPNIIIPYTDGNLLIAGKVSDSAYIMKVTPSGTLLWYRTFNFTSYPETITELFVDSDGFLVGSGMGWDAGSTFRGFIFRYNPNNNTMQWSRAMTFSSVASSIVEPTPGGPFQVIYRNLNASSPGIARDPGITQINRNTGQPTNAYTRQLNLANTHDDLVGAFNHNSSTYAFGTYNTGSQLNTTRPALSKFDANGNLIWSRLFLYNNASNNRIYCNTASVDGDTILLGFYGDYNGSGNFQTNEFGVGKADINGNLIWAKKYNVQGFSGLNPVNITAVSDGYIIMISSYSGNPTTTILMKLNRNGDIMWSKKYRNNDGGVNNAWSSKQLYTDGNNLFFAVGMYNQSNFDYATVLLKTGMDGVTEIANCPLISDIDISQANSPNLSYSVSPTYYNTTIGWTGVTATPANSSVAYSPFCTTACESCNNGIDDDGDGLPDCLDPDCCNHPSCSIPTINLGNNVVSCSNATTINAGAGYTSYTWSTGATTQSISVTQNGLYSVTVANACFSFADTIQVTFQITPTLELGPNISACENQANVINATPGFTNYIWGDGTPGPTISTYGAGTYRVTATDACGNTQTDAINVTLLPRPVIDLGPDTVICASTSYTLQGPSLAQGIYAWTPNTGLSCQNCPNPSVTPNTNTTYYLALTNAQGCSSIDSVRVSLNICFLTTLIDTAACQGSTVNINGVNYLAPSTTTITLNSSQGIDSIITIQVSAWPTYNQNFNFGLCPGQSQVFNGVTFSGNQSQTFNLNTIQGCDSTVLITTFPLPSYNLVIDTTFCENSPLTIQGFSFNSSQNRTFNLSTWQGCDSTVLVRAQMLDSVAQQFQVQACQGTSYNFNGTLIPAGTNRSFVYTAFNGCDSTVTVQVEALNTNNNQVNHHTCLGIPVVINGQPYFNDTSFCLNFNNQFGCDSIICHTVSTHSPAPLQSTSSNLPCSGNGTGSITVSSNTPDRPLSYSWLPNLSIDSVLYSSQAGIFQVTITDSYGCTASITDTIVQPSQLDVDINNINPSCPGFNDGQINISVNSGIPPFQLSVNGQVQTSLTLSNLAPGVYDIQLTDSSTCSFNQSITLANPPSIYISIWRDATVNWGDTVNLSAYVQGQGPLSYSWSPSVSCGTCLNPVVVAEGLQVYTLQVTDANGCTASDSITINVLDFNCDIFFPNAFSPNGDNLNDSWIPEALPCVELFEEILIFDRWGSLVYGARGLAIDAAGWNGKFRGQDASSSVYVYMVKLRYANGQISDWFTGDINLIR